MLGVRQAFDVQAPFIVSSQELVYGARRFRSGEAFPWKILGVSELDLLTLWSALKVDVSPAPTALPAVTVQPGALVPTLGETEGNADSGTLELHADGSATLTVAGDVEIIPMGAVIKPGGEKRTVVIDGKQLEMTAGPTISVATPEMQRAKHSKKR